MFNVDVNDVIHGNPFKELDIMYSNVVAKNDDESAKKFHDYYSTLPLSVILQASELIFKESRYGIGFFTRIMDTEFIPYCLYEIQYNQLRDFVNSVTDFSDEEKADYSKALDMLTAKIDSSCKVMIPFSAELSGSLFHGNKSYVIDLMDALYKNKYEYGDEVPEDVSSAINAIISTRVGFILYGPDIFSRVPMDSVAMEKLHEYFVSDCVGYGDFTNSAFSVILLRLMMQDDLYRKLLNNVRNKRFRDVISKWVDTDPKHLLDGVLCEPSQKEIAKVDNIISETDDVIEAVINAVNMVDTMENDNPILKDRLSAKLCIYEYYEECLSTILIHGQDFPINGTTIFGENRTVSDDISACELYAERCYDELGEEASGIFSEDYFKSIISDVEDYFESTDDEDDDNDDEDSSDDVEDNPNKKADIKTKLTNKALDADKKAREVEAKMNKNASATKRLIKAGTAIPRHIAKNIDDAVEEIRNAKKERLKKRLLDDGYRSAFWNKLKIATKYKMLGAVNIMLVPLYWLLRRSNKMKNIRLKEDIIRDFNLELDILKDKYQDAANAGNAEAKEDLRRKIDKMERELKRARYNSRALK